MSDFLVIAGRVIPVAVGSFKENEPERGGSSTRSYHGVLRTTTRWAKRNWSFTTGEMKKSDGNAFASDIALEIAVAVTGSLVAATCRVRITGTSFMSARTDDTNNWLYMYDVTMREV